MFNSLIRFIRDQYSTEEFIPLHAPTFKGRERDYVLDTIESTYVSSVGAFVDRFEKDIAFYTGSLGAVATVNGTAALHMALLLAGVKPGDLVVTQSLTFVATCNAITYCGAEPVFVDVDRETLGLSPQSLDNWLVENAIKDTDGNCRTLSDDRIIRACIPMHTFGHPVAIDQLLKVCNRWGLIVVEDAAESLGSFYKGKHTGTFGHIGILSFNGNKVITTGGGGMIITDENTAKRAKHLTTTAKQPHPFEFVHNEVGYNYRMPNINAALGCAQLEQLEDFIAAKRQLADRYSQCLANTSLQFFKEPEGCRSNYWLNAVICESLEQRNMLLEDTNSKGIMTRPIWTLMNRLPIFAHCRKSVLTNAEWLEERLVNIPSSVVFGE